MSKLGKWNALCFKMSPRYPNVINYLQELCRYSNTTHESHIEVWMFDQQSIIYQLWINRFVNCEFGRNKKQPCEVFKDVKNRRRNSLYLVGCHYHHINVNQWIYHYSNIEVWKKSAFLKFTNLIDYNHYSMFLQLY